MVIDSSRCYYCERYFGYEVGRVTKDHVTPKILGGTNAKTNLVFCCSTCNKNKGGFLLWEWETRLLSQFWLEATVDNIEWRSRVPKILNNIRSHPTYDPGIILQKEFRKFILL
jgi:5-methylcytosine-specific restriction endonuclease McrA